MRPFDFQPPRWVMLLANVFVLACLIGFLVFMKMMHKAYGWPWTGGFAFCFALMAICVRVNYGFWLGDPAPKSRAP